MKFILEGREYQLPDISYTQFCELLFAEGLSDVAWNQYLRENGMQELTKFTQESIQDGVLVYEDEDVIIKFKCVEYTEK